MTSNYFWPLQCKTGFTKEKDNVVVFLERPEFTKPNVGKMVLQTGEKKDVGKECDPLNIGPCSSSNLRLTKKYENYLENTTCTLRNSVPESWNNFATDSKTKKSQ